MSLPSSAKLSTSLGSSKYNLLVRVWVRIYLCTGTVQAAVPVLRALGSSKYTLLVGLWVRIDLYSDTNEVDNLALDGKGDNVQLYAFRVVFRLQISEDNL